MEYTQADYSRNFRTIHAVQMIKKIKYASDIVAADLKKTCKEISFDLPGADDYNNYRDFIFEHISFVKILKDFKLHPEECSSGKYTHRMVCPFKFHKAGRERTGSFRFNEQKKMFTCFGCNESGDMLRFLQYYVGGWEQLHLEKLAAAAGLIKDGRIQIPHDYIEPISTQPKDINYRILFDSGLLLRQYLRALHGSNIYITECEWADQMLIKLDKYFDMIDEDNMIDAKKIYTGLLNLIKKRKDKIILIGNI